MVFGSDSSFRFERGVDFQLQCDAIERATELVIEICGGQVGEIVEEIAKLPENKTVVVRTARIEKMLGVQIPSEPSGDDSASFGLAA